MRASLHCSLFVLATGIAFPFYSVINAFMGEVALLARLSCCHPASSVPSSDAGHHGLCVPATDCMQAFAGAFAGTLTAFVLPAGVHFW